MSSKTLPHITAIYRALRLFIAGSSLFGQRVSEKLSMHPTDMQFLNLLDLLGPMTPGALARRSGLSPGGVTIVVDRLVRAGYVKREANPGDRRSLLVRINKARQKRVSSSYESARKQFEQALEGFSYQELDTILRFLGAVNSAQVPANKMETE